MAYNEYLAERVRAELKRHRLPTEEKAMMGGLCFMVRGKMCVGVDKDRLMVRLDPADSKGPAHVVCGAGDLMVNGEARPPPPSSLTAVMRKLVVLLNHLLKNPQFKLA